MCLKNLFNRNPQIIINDLGIQLKDDKIIEWKDIKSEIVYGKLTGKLNYNKYLSFNGIDILINDYDISMKELENLLQVYRTRYKKNNPN